MSAALTFPAVLLVIGVLLFVLRATRVLWMIAGLAAVAVVVVMLSAGPVVDQVVQELANILTGKQ